MNFIRYFDYDSIVELESKTFGEALKELLLLRGSRDNVDEMVAELVAREDEVSSYIGNEIVVPSLRTSLSAQYEIIVGRAKTDIRCGNVRNADSANIIVLVLASRHERGYLTILSSVIGFFQKSSVVDRLKAANSFESFKTKLVTTIKKAGKSAGTIKCDANELFLRSAVEISRKTRCTSVMLFGNVELENIDVEGIFDDIRLLTVVQSSSKSDPVVYDSHTEIQVSVVPTDWSHGFRGAILLGITKNIIAHDEKVCCVGCSTNLGFMDTLFIMDIQKEFRPIFASNTKFLQCDIKPEIFERILSIAFEIAIEGREGKAVGCLFVIGDINKISLFMKPLVLNPFYGYQESERSVLNEFMNETIKEFSLIDGAFVIRGDGVIESAGTLIYTPSHNIVMPSGFGTRHAAAASISWAAECIAIAVSESTRTVTLFQNGQMLQVMQK
jgi:DNA integrity scanning protein DisA with diadenylate cyclase activity